jgi:hypothetical protein
MPLTTRAKSKPNILRTLGQLLGQTSPQDSKDNSLNQNDQPNGAGIQMPIHEEVANTRKDYFDMVAIDNLELKSPEQFVKRRDVKNADSSDLRDLRFSIIPHSCANDLQPDPTNVIPEEENEDSEQKNKVSLISLSDNLITIGDKDLVDELFSPVVVCNVEDDEIINGGRRFDGNFFSDKKHVDEIMRMGEGLSRDRRGKESLIFDSE